MQVESTSSKQESIICPFSANKQAIKEPFIVKALSHMIYDRLALFPSNNINNILIDHGSNHLATRLESLYNNAKIDLCQFPNQDTGQSTFKPHYFAELIVSLKALQSPMHHPDLLIFLTQHLGSNGEILLYGISNLWLNELQLNEIFTDLKFCSPQSLSNLLLSYGLRNVVTQTELLNFEYPNFDAWVNEVSALIETELWHQTFFNPRVLYKALKQKGLSKKSVVLVKYELFCAYAIK